jgi:hypothetical protein
VTFARALPVSWLIFWRGLPGGVLAGTVPGFPIGLVWVMAGFPHAALQPFSMMIGLVAGGVVMVVATGMALRKNYRHFRIILVRV